MQPPASSESTAVENTPEVPAEDALAHTVDDAAPLIDAPAQPPRESAIPGVVSCLVISFLIGLSLALCIAYLTVDRAPLVGGNTLKTVFRNRMLIAMGSSGAGFSLVTVGYLLWRRSFVALSKAQRLLRALSPLALAAPLPLFFDWRVFNGRELLLVTSALVYGLLCERTVRGSLLAIREYNPRNWPALLATKFPGAYQRTPTYLAIGLALFLAGYFSYFTILHHYRVQTASFDLASYNNILWNLMHGHWFKSSPVLGPEGSHIHHHAEFALYSLLPIYALRPNADTALALQAVLVGAAVIPLYLLARRRLGSPWQAVLIAYAYGIHAPLHGPVFYDFHLLTTAPFWIGWVLYCFDAGKRKALVITWILALLVREDQGACMAAAALFFVVSKSRPAWALWGGVLSVVYFGVIKFAVMPAHNAGNMPTNFSWMYQGLIPQGEQGFGAVLRTVLINPVFTLGGLLDQGKLIYLLKTFGPVLLLPLRLGRTWLLFIPAAVFTLLSTGYTPLYETYFQYTSNWTAYLFFATAVVIATLKERSDGWARSYAALIALALTATIYSYHQGAIFQHNNFRGGFRQVMFKWVEADQKRIDQLYGLIDMIPKDASVAATETEAPHVSSRENCFTMRYGYLDAEYLLLNSAEIRSGASLTYFKQAKDTGLYKRLATKGPYQLWKRGRPEPTAAATDSAEHEAALPAGSATAAPIPSVTPP